MKIEQTCIKSILHGPEYIRTYLQNLVTATSELEARGSLIYTLALLRCNEQEDRVPIEMFSQGFMTRCLGVARSSAAVIVYSPSEVCTKYLKEARGCVPPVLDYDFSHFNQLINQLGRRMHTIIMTSLCTHMNSRRARTIRTSLMSSFPNLSKSVCSFVMKHILWSLSGAPDTSCRRPDPSRYKDPEVQVESRCSSAVGPHHHRADQSTPKTAPPRNTFTTRGTFQQRI
jgi:hypothetical protein